MAEIIELEELLKTQKQLQKSVDEARNTFDQANNNLGIFNSKTRDLLSSYIKEGKTTGNVLQDRCIVWFGLDRPHIDKILKFSDRLVKAKGQECFMIFRWQERIWFGGDAHEGDFISCQGYILGILSGEELKIDQDKSVVVGKIPSVTLPFTKHVTLGFRARTEESVSGPLTLSADFFEPEPCAMTFFNYVLTGNSGMGTECMIYFEDEQSSLPVHLRNADGLRALLHAPTEGELHSAEHI